MKINKWIILGSVAVAIIGFAMIVLNYNSIIESIGISLLSGAIVSTVTATLYYINERQTFISKIKMMISLFYVHLSVIKRMMDDVITKVTSINQFSTLNFESMKSVADDSIVLINGYSTGIFSGFLPNGKVSCNVRQFESFMPDLRNLKYNLSKLHSIALDADILFNQIQMKQIKGQIVTQDEENLYKAKRDLVTMRSAKVHEYEASLLMRLDEIAIRFFSLEEWSLIKRSADDSVSLLLEEALH